MQQRHRLLNGAVTLVAVLVCSCGIGLPAGPDQYTALALTDSTANAVPYRLFVPPTYDPDQEYPLVTYRGRPEGSEHAGGRTRARGFPQAGD